MTFLLITLYCIRVIEEFLKYIMGKTKNKLINVYRELWHIPSPDQSLSALCDRSKDNSFHKYFNTEVA